MKIVKILFLFSFIQPCWGQYVGLGSFYHENLGMVNSSYLAKNAKQELFLDYRKQWASVPNSPEYINGMFSVPLKNNKIGLGFQVNTHEIGALKRQKIAASYRYRLKFSDTQFLSFGIGIGAERTLIDLSRIQAQDMGELANYQLSQRSVLAAFNVGINYRIRNFDFGFSADFYSGSKLSFQNPTTNQTLFFSKVPTYSFQTSWSKAMNEKWTYRPSLIAYSTQGLPIFVDLTNHFVFDEKIDLGVGYRQIRDMNVSFGYTFVNQLKMMYLYQFPVASRTTSLGGTHEVALIFKLNNNQSGEQTFGTSSRKAEELRQELDQTQLKIDQLNRQLDSLNKRMSNQDQVIDELKKAQVSSAEIKNMVDSIGRTSSDVSSIKIQKYEVVNVSSQADIDALVEDADANYRIVLGAFRNVDKARELNKTLTRELSYSLDIVEVKVGEKLMYFICQKENYTSVKLAGTKLVNFKKSNKSKYEPYLNGEPWILKMKS